MYLLNIPKNLEQREQDFIPRADKLSDMFCLIKHGQINDFLPLVAKCGPSLLPEKALALVHPYCIIGPLSKYCITRDTLH